MVLLILFKTKDLVMIVCGLIIRIVVIKWAAYCLLEVLFVLPRSQLFSNSSSMLSLEFSVCNCVVVVVDVGRMCGCRV